MAPRTCPLQVRASVVCGGRPQGDWEAPQAQAPPGYRASKAQHGGSRLRAGGQPWAAQPGSEGRVASPEVDAPDVLLDAGRGAQHLPAVLPDAFEHHLHGVLERGEDRTAGENEPISGTFGPSTPFPSFLAKAHRTAQRRRTNPPTGVLPARFSDGEAVLFQMASPAPRPPSAVSGSGAPACGPQAGGQAAPDSPSFLSTWPQVGVATSPRKLPLLVVFPELR